MALYYDNHMIGQEVIYLGKVSEVLIPDHLCKGAIVRIRSTPTGIVLYVHPEDLQAFKRICNETKTI